MGKSLFKQKFLSCRMYSVVLMLGISHVWVSVPEHFRIVSEEEESRSLVHTLVKPLLLEVRVDQN